MFLVFNNADMNPEEPKQTAEIAHNFELWRIGTDFYHLLMQLQIAIINL